jgi:hypothetical protein
VTAVTAVPRRDPATACRSLGGHGPAVTAVTAVIVGSRIARAVTAVIIAPAVTAVTRRAFVTYPGGHGPPWPQRPPWLGELSSRALGGTGATVGAVTAVTAATASPLGFAVDAVTTLAVELRPARALIWWGEGLRSPKA